MQNFLRLWLNAGAQITYGGQVQTPRQKISYRFSFQLVQFLILLTYDFIHIFSVLVGYAFFCIFKEF